jgi:hypothetical protein
MTSPRSTRRRQRATAVRQALRLVEAETSSLAWDNVGLGQRTVHVRPQQPRTSAAWAALLAVGLPPPIAAALCRRLQLLPDQEDQPSPPQEAGAGSAARSAPRAPRSACPPSIPNSSPVGPAAANGGSSPPGSPSCG